MMWTCDICGSMADGDYELPVDQGLLEEEAPDLLGKMVCEECYFEASEEYNAQLEVDSRRDLAAMMSQESGL